MILFGALALTPLIEHQAIDVARLSLLVATLGLWLQFWLLTRSIPELRFREILAVSLRPLVAAAIMATALVYITNQFALPLALEFAVKVLLGVIIYCLSIFLLWVGPQSSRIALPSRMR